MVYKKNLLEYHRGYCSLISLQFFESFFWFILMNGCTPFDSLITSSFINCFMSFSEFKKISKSSYLMIESETQCWEALKPTGIKTFDIRSFLAKAPATGRARWKRSESLRSNGPPHVCLEKIAVLSNFSASRICFYVFIVTLRSLAKVFLFGQILISLWLVYLHGDFPELGKIFVCTADSP